jgi:two-component system NtrC family sensor kinase
LATRTYSSRKRYWTLLIVAVSMLPLLVISTVILYDFRESDREKVTAHLEELVGKHMQTIDSFLQAKLGEIRVLARTFDYVELSDESFLQERLSVMQQEESPVMVDLGVVNSEGTQVAYAGPFRLARVDYSDADWFQQAMHQEYFISDVFRGLRGLPHFIVAVRSVRGEQPWILRATIDFAAFNDLVEEIRIGRTGSAFILNREGRFQTESRHDLDLASGPYMALLRETDRGGEEIHVLEDPSHATDKYIYVAAYLKDGDWMLVYQQLAKEAFSSFGRTLNLALVILAVAGLASFVAAFFLAKKMVSCIAESDQQRQIMNQQIVETGKLAAIGELAAGIAHEINNPVATMVEEAGWMEDLLEDLEFQDSKQLEEFRRALQQIKNQGSRCKQITHKLLSFARKTDARISEVSIYSLVDEMVALSSQRAKYANVEIVTSLQRNLPTLHASVAEMQQVFLNLINNAIDAMEKKGGKIFIKARKENQALVIRVEDTGPGIPQANLERIFDPFFTTKPVGKGTGLGLSICYGIISKMGGKIDVRSTIDVGTSFRIVLPLTEQEESVATPVEARIMEGA